MLTINEQITRESYDKFAKGWIDSHDSPGFWAKEFEQFQKVLPTGRILEIGSGGGRDAAELVRLGYDYVGTDISTGLIREARFRNPSLEFIEVSVYDLDFDSKFDGFWCAAVLLHIPKNRIDESLQSIRRNVNKNGVGLITIKDGYGEEITPGPFSRFFSYWTDKEFSDVLRDNSFSVEWRGSKMSDNTPWLSYIVRKR